MPSFGTLDLLRSADALLSARSREQIVARALLLVAFIGTIDHLTGYELSLSIFYLIPVGIAAWYAGSRDGTLLCVVSALIWLLTDLSSGHPYTQLAVPCWNAGVRLGFFVITAKLLVRLHRALELEASLAQQDGLTGILNARTFRQRYEALALLAGRHGHPMTLGYLDLDGFKGVNDSLGHAVGDEVLKAVATALAGRLRTSDLVARVGGDEFAVLLPETDLAGARALFVEMRESLVRLSAQNCWPIGFSIGVAVFHSPPPSPEEAIRCGDDLMYKVKRSGKNSILFDEYAVEAGAA